MIGNQNCKHIGCILANIHTGSAQNLWSSITNEASKTSDAFFLFPGGKLNSRNDSDYLRNSIYSLINPENFEGLISWSSAIGGAVSLSELSLFHKQFERIPYVTICHKMPNHPNISFDAYTGMYNLVTHFITEHCAQRIAFIQGPENHSSAQDRLKAYKDALTDSEKEIDLNLITSPFPWNDGEKAITELYVERKLVPGQDFDVLIASSDMMLFAATQYLQKLNFNIPEHYLAGGFNDSAESSLSSSAFTTVHMPYEGMGITSFYTLQSLLKDSDSSIADITLPTNLIIRDSCGCVTKIQQPTFSSEEDLLQKLSALFLIDKDSATALISPLFEALKNEDPVLLFKLIDLVLERFFKSSKDIRQLIRAVNLIQNSGFFSSTFLHKIAPQIQTKLITGQSRGYSIKQYETRQRYSIVNSLKCDLLTAHNKNQLISILKTYLPQLGIHTTALTLNIDLDNSLFVGGFSPNENSAQEEIKNIVFPSNLLVPESKKNLFDAGVYLVQPLFTENQPLGYIIFNVSFIDGALYEDLRASISSALHGIHLFEQALLAKQLAEKAEHSKTEFFANTSSDLIDPLKDFIFKITQIENNLDESKDLLAEQLLFLKSQIQAQIEKTGLIIDLTLSEINELPLSKRLFSLPEILKIDLQHFPLLFGDPEQISRALGKFISLYKKNPTCTYTNNHVLLTFSDSSVSLNWEQTDLAFAEKCIYLHSGDIKTTSGSCFISFPLPSFSGISSLDTKDFLEIDFDTATFDEICSLFEKRKISTYKNVSICCYSTSYNASTVLELVEQKINENRKPPILFIEPTLSDYGPWATSNTSISILSIDEFNEKVEITAPSLIVLESMNIAHIQIIRRNPITTLVPILIIEDSFIDDSTFKEISELPRIMICNRGVIDSQQFNQRINSLLSGDDLLPPHTGSLVKKAILYFNLNASSQIVRWKLADFVNVSEDYLTRIFHKEMGLSLWEYLNRHRIHLATELLLHTNNTIYEVAEKTGFQDQAYFCRVFKKIHGVPPGKIRTKND